MNDTSLLESFEQCTLSPADLDHRQHVRLAWLYLREAPFERGALRFCEGIRRFAQSLGHAERYHETITWGYLALVNEHLRAGGDAADFNAFVRAHSDLVAPKLGALAPHYDERVLASPEARRAFVLPRGRAR